MPDPQVDSPLLRAAIQERDLRAQPTQARVGRLRTVSGWAGLVVTVVGLAVVAGWALDIDRLKRVAPGLVTMKLNTAVCLALLGVGVWVLSRPAVGPRASRAVGVLAAVVALLGAATLVEYVTGSDLRIDDPFGLDRVDAIDTSEPGRMSPMTAVAVCAVAGALLALQGRRVRVGQSLAWATLVVSATAVVGYLFAIESLYGVHVYTSMALHTALVLTLLSVAVLGLRAGDGFMLLATGDSAGGVVVRRLLPWVLLVPSTVGGFLVVGLEQGWYDDRFALAVLVSVTTVAGAAGVWIQGRRLRNVDLRRAGAEDVLHQLEESLLERDRLTLKLTGSERHAREVVANSADAYIALSSEGLVEDWNDTAARLFGWSREEASGRSLDQLIIPAELAAAHRAGLRRAAQAGHGPLLGRPVEVEAVHRAGHRLHIELTIWAVPDEERLGFHAFLRDVTLRKAAEAELRRANDDLGQFAGVVAHDLRSPLTVITGFAQLLDAHTVGTETDARAREWIARMDAAAQRGQDLITDLLAFTQVGQADLVTTRVDLDTLVGEVVEEQRALGHERARIEVSPLPTIEGDPGLLRLLFANLVGNALKYAGADATPTLCVDVSPERTPGRVVLRVSDDGPGVAVVDRDRIFDMFQRGSEVGSVTGNGIGLAISRRVVERHQGRIWVEDGDLGGSAFLVELPLVLLPR